MPNLGDSPAVELAMDAGSPQRAELSRSGSSVSPAGALRADRVLARDVDRSEIDGRGGGMSTHH